MPPQKNSAAETPAAADVLEGVALPQEQTEVFGHEAIKAHFARLLAEDRLHQAYIFSGARGLGKATFAYGLARFLLASPAIAQKNAFPGHPPDAEVCRQVAALSHPNLFVLQRRWDFDAKRFTTGIPVEDVRRLVRALSLAPGHDTWRVCLVDAAGDMTAGAFNALLKTLEEPPARTVFFLISHNAERLAPTIRSRCQSIRFQPLDDEALQRALDGCGGTPGDSPEDRARLLRFADGSVRRALVFARAGGFALARALEDLLSGSAPPAAAMRFAEEVAAGSEDGFAVCCELIVRQTSARARAQALAGASAAELIGFADAAEYFNERLRTADVFNLDKRTTVLALLARARC